MATFRRLELADSKYTVVMNEETGTISRFERHMGEWPGVAAFRDSSLVLAMAQRIEELEDLLDNDIPGGDA